MFWGKLLTTIPGSSNRCHGNRPSSLFQEACSWKEERTRQLWPFPGGGCRSREPWGRRPPPRAASQPVPVVGGEGVRLLRLGGSTRLGVTSSTHPGMPSPEWVPSPYEYFLPSSYCVPSTDRPGLAGTGLSKRNKTSVVTELTLESGRQTLTHMCKIQRLLAGHRCYGEKEVRKGVQRT